MEELENLKNYVEVNNEDLNFNLGTIIKVWKETYGEDFIEQYDGFVKILIDGKRLIFNDAVYLTVDLLKEILVDIQDLRQDCYCDEQHGSDIEWEQCKDGDYLDYEKVEYRINQKIKELRNIT